LWQSVCVDTPAFVLKLVVIARSFPRGPLPSEFLSGLYRPIPQVHPAIRPSSTHCSALDGSSLSLNHCLFFPFSSLISLQSLFFQLSFLIMTSLAVSSSASSLHSASPLSFHTASSPPSPKPLATSSASSSQVSFSQADEG
jgi:hypothetical protein